jgi:hypothetical protein
MAKKSLLHSFDPIKNMKQEFLEFLCERLEAPDNIFEEHTDVKRKAYPRDCYQTEEGNIPL